ncbi:MAG TPA: trypsin-like peptidase domain-containing protein [Microbacteriaceae bacterium]|nr:trypsin-like peptidase domain-containing protein [Microbacteriaceae bacterium]
MTNGTDPNESTPVTPEEPMVPNATVYTPGAAPAPYGSETEQAAAAASVTEHGESTPSVPHVDWSTVPSPVAMVAEVPTHAPGDAQDAPAASSSSPSARPLGGGSAPAVVSTARAALPVAATVAIAALVGGGVGAGVVGASWAFSSSPLSSSVAAPAQKVTINDTSSVSTVSAVAAKALPSVVTIDVSNGSGGGTGSGVVISSDGYIVTNTHVVTLDGASSTAEISVTTADARQFVGKLIGTDPNSDLAVIKIDATGLPAIEFANSDSLNVGATTIAIGAPMELSNTVTQGIISALYRGIEIASSAAPDSGSSDGNGSDNSSPFKFWNYNQNPQGSQGRGGNIALSVIQTDAAINPGNSGGALLDSTGKLIGINVAILSGGSSQSSGTAGNIGIGFAIPSNQVQRVAKEIISSGTATHGLLGASVTSTAKDAGQRGAVVKEVTPGGAAAKAGIQAGDIITQFNGIRVRDQIDLTALVRSQAAGAESTVTFVRNGVEQSVKVTLGTFSG